MTGEIGGSARDGKMNMDFLTLKTKDLNPLDEPTFPRSYLPKGDMTSQVRIKLESKGGF